LEELKARIDKLENRDIEELLTILEIMSNVTFFGEMKRANCEYSKYEQCSLFCLQSGAKNKIPAATECRIPDCAAAYSHCHLEANNLTCTFCPQWRNVNTLSDLSKKASEEK